MIVLSLLDPKSQLDIRPKRLPLAIVPLSIKLQTPHRRAILAVLIAALVDNRPHLDAKLVLPLRDAAVGVGDPSERVRDGSKLLVGRGEAGQCDFYGCAGAADDGVEDVARDWGFGGGHCTLETLWGSGLLFVVDLKPALDTSYGPALSEVAAFSYKQGREYAHHLA
ncbi:hypothetical protein V493_05203 [Pseudogymnoascus sp. VKM F-4281 (FW-2241)]|nr:hypothetical protein V493_05203 [Pseudogymnoascus sp. VKM F-4281 (FW-2241)]